MAWERTSARKRVIFLKAKTSLYPIVYARIGIQRRRTGGTLQAVRFTFAFEKGIAGTVLLLAGIDVVAPNILSLSHSALHAISPE